MSGRFVLSLLIYPPLIDGREVSLLEAVNARAKQKRQAAAIHAYRMLKPDGKPIHNRSDAEVFLARLRAEISFLMADC